MKLSYINILFLSIFILSGCSEDKTFIFPGHRTDNVNFTVSNKNIENGEAISVFTNLVYEKVFNNNSKTVEFEYYHPDYDSSYESIETFSQPQYYTNAILAGGNNTLTFTFYPNSPEEESAEFIMPAGKIYTATRQNPSFEWTLNLNVMQNLIDNGHQSNDELLVTAKSSYTKNGELFENIGYIFIDVLSDFIYYPSLDKWYLHSWTSGMPMQLQPTVNFEVVNTSVGDIDNASSANLNEIIYRDPMVTIPITYYLMPSTGDNSPYRKDIDLRYQFALWTGGDNSIKVTYHPACDEEKDNVVFILPTGERFTPTSNDLSFTININKELISNIDMEATDMLMVKAESNYIKDGIQFNATGYILLDIDTELWLNNNDGKWYFSDWTK